MTLQSFPWALVWIIGRSGNFFQLRDFLPELPPWSSFCRAASQGRPWGRALVTGPAQPGPRTPWLWSPSPSIGGGELALKPGPGADPADRQLPSGSFPTLRGRARVYSRGRLAACRWPAGVAGVAGVAVGLQPSASASAAATSRAGRKSPRQGTSTVGGWRCCSLPRPGGQAGPRRGPGA